MGPLVLLLALTAAPLGASAQISGTSAPDPGSAIAQADSAAARVEGEVACLRAAAEALRETARLMREARDQMTNARASADARADAQDAIRSLLQRVVRLERQALACRAQPSAAARSNEPVEGVRYVDPPADAEADAVALPNPATREIERDVALVTNVRALVGEQVDGRGTVEASAVRGAVRGIGPQLSRCYDRMVDRGALVSGQIILTFTVSPTGSVGRVRTEGSTFRDAGFARCVRSAGAQLRVGRAALGGDATFAYTLQFPGR